MWSILSNRHTVKTYDLRICPQELVKQQGAIFPQWPTTNTANQLNFEASILGLSDPAFPTAGKKVDPLHLRPCVRGAHQKRSCYSRRSPKSRARLLRPCSLNLSFFTVESAVIRMLPFNRQWQRQTRHAAATKPGVPI